MEYLGGLGQLSLFVTKVLTLRRIGFVVPVIPEKNSVSAELASWLLLEVVPEYTAAIVMEQTNGPAWLSDIAREFLRRIDISFLIIPLLCSEGGLLNSVSRFLADCTIFRTPGYLIHVRRFSLDCCS